MTSRQLGGILEYMTDMKKEDYVSLEVAKILKEKGFDEPCCSAYDRKGNINADQIPVNWNREYDWTLSRPSLYEAQKWLREKHQLHIDVGMCGDCSTDADGNKCEEWDFWTFDMYYTTNFTNHIHDCFGEYDTYEEALNAGILEALKMI